MVSYDIVVGNSKLFSINPEKNILKKRMLRYIAQDYLNKRERSLPMLKPYDISKRKLFRGNAHFGEKNKLKVSWDETIEIFNDNIKDIGDMTLSDIDRLVGLHKLPFSKNNLTLPIKELNDNTIINLLGKGEQTEEGEKWINTNLSPEETKTYLDEVWEEIGGSEHKREYSFNDTKIKVNKLTSLNVSQLRGRKYSTSNDDDDKDPKETLTIPSKIIPKNYWEKRNIKDLRGIEVYNFDDIYGDITTIHIGDITTTDEKNILEMIKIKKAKIELDSFSGYPAIALIEHKENLMANAELTISDTIVNLNGFKPIDEKNGLYVLWFNEKPYDSSRWKKESVADDKRREIHLTTKTDKKDTKEEILRATILMAIRELITNMKVSYQYNITVNHFKNPSPITIKYKPLNDITVTEFGARSKSSRKPSQDYGRAMRSEYSATTILNPKATNTDTIQAQRLLQHFYYNYNTLNNTIKKLIPQESN
jgi:hypothetical protein